MSSPPFAENKYRVQKAPQARNRDTDPLKRVLVHPSATFTSEGGVRVLQQQQTLKRSHRHATAGLSFNSGTAPFLPFCGCRRLGARVCTYSTGTGYPRQIHLRDILGPARC